MAPAVSSRPQNPQIRHGSISTEAGFEQGDKKTSKGSSLAAWGRRLSVQNRGLPQPKPERRIREDGRSSSLLRNRAGCTDGAPLARFSKIPCHRPFRCGLQLKPPSSTSIAPARSTATFSTAFDESQTPFQAAGSLASQSCISQPRVTAGLAQPRSTDVRRAADVVRG